MADIKAWLIICMFVLLVCRDTKNFRSHILCYISSYICQIVLIGWENPGVWPLCHNFKKKKTYLNNDKICLSLNHLKDFVWFGMMFVFWYLSFRSC